MPQKFIKIGLISISDRASSGIYKDKGIPELESWLKKTIKNKLISLNTPSNNKYLGTKISPYSKEFRYSFNQTNLNIIFQFLNLYHNSKTNKFKITQLFDTDLIEKIFMTSLLRINLR